MILKIIRKNLVTLISIIVILLAVIFAINQRIESNRLEKVRKIGEDVLRAEKFIESNNFKEAQLVIDTFEAGSPEVEKLRADLKSRSKSQAIAMAKVALEGNDETKATTILAQYLEAKDSEAQSLIDEYKNKKNEDSLPPLAFPIPIQASLSRVTKFHNEYFGKFLTFDLAGASVDDLKTNGYGYYLQGATDYSTGEYVSSFTFRFILTEPMAKVVYEKLPGARSGLIRYEISCVPQIFEVLNQIWCKALSFRIYNAGGKVTGDWNLTLEETFNKSKRSQQKEILQVYFGPKYPT